MKLFLWLVNSCTLAGRWGWTAGRDRGRYITRQLLGRCEIGQSEEYGRQSGPSRVQSLDLSQPGFSCSRLLVFFFFLSSPGRLCDSLFFFSAWPDADDSAPMTDRLKPDGSNRWNGGLTDGMTGWLAEQKDAGGRGAASSLADREADGACLSPEVINRQDCMVGSDTRHEGSWKCYFSLTGPWAA